MGYKFYEVSYHLNEVIDENLVELTINDFFTQVAQDIKPSSNEVSDEDVKEKDDSPKTVEVKRSGPIATVNDGERSPFFSPRVPW